MNVICLLVQEYLMEIVILSFNYNSHIELSTDL